MTAAVLAWFLACMAYLCQALFRESELWARMKQRWQLWRQVRRDLNHATGARRLEIEAFLSVLEDALQDRGHLSYVADTLDIEDRLLRSVRIIASMPALGPARRKADCYTGPTRSRRQRQYGKVAIRAGVTSADSGSYSVSLPSSL
jgi:hypothetical protein